jgi:hypothetical protein
MRQEEKIPVTSPHRPKVRTGRRVADRRRRRRRIRREELPGGAPRRETRRYEKMETGEDAGAQQQKGKHTD